MKNDKDLVYNFGRMEVIIKEIGIMICLMVLEDMYIKIKKHMKEIGLKNLQMEKVNFIKLMVLLIVNGKMICKMDLVKKNGMMDILMKVNIWIV